MNGTGTQTWIQNWSCDRYGNRNFVTGSGHTTTLGSCPTAQCNPSIDTATNRFSGSQGYTFDKNGNIVVDAEGRQFTFNGDNKQTEVKDASNSVVGTYYYDGEGKRVKKITHTGDNVIFVYANGKLVEERNATTNAVQTSYIYAGSQLLATETSSGTNYTVTDNLGSPRVIVDGSGGVVARRDFLPFGEELFADGVYRKTTDKYSSTGQDIVRQRFTGYQKDIETGLDFAEARMYENRHGRFTAIDPLLASGKSADPQTFNRYAYVMNRPLILTDPTGLQAGSDVKAWETFKTTAFAIANPIAASTIGLPTRLGENLSSIAGRFAANSGLDTSNRSGGERNALRHGIWSALISQKLGAATAKSATDAHEPSGSVEVPEDLTFQDANVADNAVDLENNAIGIEVGTQTAGQNISAKDTAIAVLNKFKDEGLFVTKINKDGTETMVKTKIGQTEYDRAMKDWNTRDNVGFTAAGRKEVEEKRKEEFNTNYRRAGAKYQE